MLFDVLPLYKFHFPLELVCNGSGSFEGRNYDSHKFLLQILDLIVRSRFWRKYFLVINLDVEVSLSVKNWCDLISSHHRSFT